MVLTSRRGFVKGAAAACIALANLEARGFDDGAAGGLPNSVFAYEFGDISPEQQAGFARDYGFAGTVFDHARQIPERLRALDDAHLQLFFLWLTVDISHGQTIYEPGMEAAIAQKLQSFLALISLVVESDEFNYEIITKIHERAVYF